mmetsp:Transcript_8438/g.11636  ORF Transcript_8438/g.11636 Transcript_8438/m.11636 type:complete len:80 (+) Transcript_8438:382-621(+)
MKNQPVLPHDDIGLLFGFVKVENLFTKDPQDPNLGDCTRHGIDEAQCVVLECESCLALSNGLSSHDLGPLADGSGVIVD